MNIKNSLIINNKNIFIKSLLSTKKLPFIVKLIISKKILVDNIKNNHVLSVVKDIKRITGQLPIIINYKKNNIENKNKENYIGFKVTLRKNKMFVFIDKLVHFVIPRLTEFKLFDINSFDKQGNFNLTIKNYFWFPEMEVIFPKVPESLNINIVIKNTTNNNENSILLLQSLGLPF